MKQTDKATVRAAMPPRPDNAHKGTMGTLLSICGSYGMAGACMLSSMAALRSGVGLLQCAVPESIYPIVAGRVPESVYLPLTQNADGRIAAANTPYLLSQNADAVLLGCGLGNCGDTRMVVSSFVRQCDKPMVLDADALNVLADAPDILKAAKAPVIITPHPAEMARLAHITTQEVNHDRALTARSFAARYRVIVVLKGAGTVIASPDGSALLNPTGNSGMAKGGSGDVLAGVCASLLAQSRGSNAFVSAAAAVFLHGLAGDFAAERLGKASMLPRDIIDELPRAFTACE